MYTMKWKYVEIELYIFSIIIMPDVLNMSIS